MESSDIEVTEDSDGEDKSQVSEHIRNRHVINSHLQATMTTGPYIVVASTDMHGQSMWMMSQRNLINRLTSMKKRISLVETYLIPVTHLMLVMRLILLLIIPRQGTCSSQVVCIAGC